MKKIPDNTIIFQDGKKLQVNDCKVEFYDHGICFTGTYESWFIPYSSIQYMISKNKRSD